MNMKSIGPILGVPMNLGQLSITANVYNMMTDKNFEQFVLKSFAKYVNGDWGDTCKEDQVLNNNAIFKGERILAVYNYDSSTTIWIITEWDRSVTTILFPYEY